MRLAEIREAREFASRFASEYVAGAPEGVPVEADVRDLKQAARLIESLARELARAKHAIVASRRHLKEFAE